MATKNKKTFLRPMKGTDKNPGVTNVAGEKLLNAGIRGGTFISAAYGGKKLKDAIVKKNPESKMTKVIGPAAFVVGTMIDVFVDQPQAEAFGQGLATYGLVETTASFLKPEDRAKIGLSGIGENQNETDTTTTTDQGGAAFSYADIMAQAAAEAENQQSQANNQGQGTDTEIDTGDGEGSEARAM